MMKIIRSYVAASLCCLFAVTPAVGEESAWDIFAKGRKTVLFEVENDSIPPVRTDGDYTNGLKLTFSARSRQLYCLSERKPAASSTLKADGVLEPFDGSPCAMEDGQKWVVKSLSDVQEAPAVDRQFQKHLGLYIGSNMYTPSDIRWPPPRIPADERPYAGWSYVGFSRDRLWIDDGLNRMEFEIGCVGPCSRADRLQTWWHDVGGWDTPRGWDSQIEDALGLQFNYEYRPGIGPSAKSGSGPQGLRWWDFTPRVRTQLGTVFTNASAGGIVRLGRMKGYFDGIGLSTPIQKDFLSPPRKANLWELFLFATADARAVLYNTTIQGGLFNDDSPFTQDPRRLVFDWEFGFAGNIGPASLLVSLAARSTEVEAQSFDMFRHRWVRINLAVHFGGSKN